MTQNPRRRLVRLADAAEYSGLSTRTLRRYIAEERITGYRFGPHLIQVDLDDLDVLAPLRRMLAITPVGGNETIAPPHHDPKEESVTNPDQPPAPEGTNKRSELERCFGHPDTLDQLANQVANATTDELGAALNHKLRLAALNMQGAALRLRRRTNAQRRAEAQMDRSLASMQVSALAEEGIDPAGFYVYCLWGHDTERPLYVGMSTNVLSRLGAHLGNRARRRFITRVTLTRCKSSPQMRTTELKLIRHYQPEWNIADRAAPTDGDTAVHQDRNP